MRRPIRNLVLLCLALCGVLFLCPMIGQTLVPWSAAFAAGGVEHDIFVKTRLPRLLLIITTSPYYPT